MPDAATYQNGSLADWRDRTQDDVDAKKVDNPFYWTGNLNWPCRRWPSQMRPRLVPKRKEK